VVEIPRCAPPGVSVRPSPAGPRRRTQELQAATEGQTGVAPCASRIAGPEGRALILVVEDNAEMNRFICEGLEPHYRVASALNGREGVPMAMRLHPDIIITDVMMPELGGDELVGALRAHPDLKDIPVIVLTAKADDELRVRLLREGAQDYLTKPCSMEELLARVGNILALKRAEESSRTLSQRLLHVSQASMEVYEAVAGLPESSMDAVLKTIVLQAQALTGASYAAVGLGNDPNRPFNPWVSVGVSQEVERAIGRHPRPVGTLGIVAQDGQVCRLRDVREDPSYRGVPAQHPEVTSFLGVPISFRGQSVGNLYLANKRGGDEFTDHDQAMVEMLAARVGAAVETARLYQAQGMERAWLQMVVEQAPEGILIVDAHGRITVQNRGLLTLASNVGTRDPLGNPINLDMRTPSGGTTEPGRLPHIRALREGEVTSQEEGLLRRADGTLVPVLLSAAPVRDARGAIAGACLVVQDITVMKQLERLREEWTSMVAHDLRQPVQTIAMAAEMLARTSTGMAEVSARAVDSIRRGAASLNRMISDLSDASRLEARRLTLQRRAVGLAALIRDTVEHDPDVASRCTVEVSSNGDEKVWGDPMRLAQVVGNLLSNAARYSDPGTPIDVTVEQRDGFLEVVVTNRGHGIPVEELGRIFERFERGAHARGLTAGTGLGLHIAKGLVEAHGGRIWAESELDGLTRFHFTIPLLGAEVQPEDRRPRAPRGDSPSLPH
ncbi:MAG: ATP-binding protein, partial [Myxococcota bacterium]